jgi:hypothetical protein
MLRGMSRSAISPNGRVLRHPGDLEWLERRRRQAADLFAQGKTRAPVWCHVPCVDTSINWTDEGV